MPLIAHELQWTEQDNATTIGITIRALGRDSPTQAPLPVSVNTASEEESIPERVFDQDIDMESLSLSESDVSAITPLPSNVPSLENSEATGGTDEGDYDLLGTSAAVKAFDLLMDEPILYVDALSLPEPIMADRIGAL